MRRTIRNKLFSLWDIGWIMLDQVHSTLGTKFSLWFQGCRQGKNLQTTGKIWVKARAAGTIEIGTGVRLLAGLRSNRVGMSGPVFLHTWEGGHIEIGDGTGGSAIVISSRIGIKIGKHVNLGGNVRIFDHDFHCLDAAARRGPHDGEACARKPVVIGDDVFVGAESIILKGVTLGDRVVVGAGSVVTKSFPADSLIAGNPAVLIRTGTDSSGKARNGIGGDLPY